MSFFFFNDTATTEIYTLSLHDALPIYEGDRAVDAVQPSRHVEQQAEQQGAPVVAGVGEALAGSDRLLRRGSPRARLERRRSEEHTSELQSRQYLVCRLLLEKKKTQCHL